MRSKREILEDVKNRNLELRVYDREGNGRYATQDEIQKLPYWELYHAWRQARHTRKIMTGEISITPAFAWWRS